MKQQLLIITLFFSVAAAAQDVDSSRIAQTITLPQRYHEYIISHMTNKGTADAINYLNQVRSQMETVKGSNKPITTTMASAFIRDRFIELAQVSEGEASQYNENLLPLFGSQITNPWLGNAVGDTRYRNWKRRDEAIDVAHDWLMQINKLQ